MDAYIYQAALICEDCAAEIMARKEPDADSDRWPQGPYPDGGGESDCEEFCDLCGEPLDNPLTSDGLAFRFPYQTD